MKKIISIILASSLLLLSVGCTNTAPVAKADAKNLMENVVAESVDDGVQLSDEDGAKLMDFSLQLFKNSLEEEKTLVSPLSVISALGMTANGANGETLKEFEEMFGLGSIDEFNKYLAAYAKGLPSDEKYKFNLANSIWLNDSVGFVPNEEFLQTNANYYNAEIYEAPFNNATKDTINSWVNENTDEMIPTIINEIDDGTIMYLINALAFDAEWDNIYNESNIFTDKFHKEDGGSKDVEFMFSKESKFLKGENYKGFIKDYVDGKYSFVAILPDEGVKIADFVEGLDYGDLYNNLSNPEATQVITHTPKFSYAFSTSLSETLKTMGLNKAFEGGAADFTGMGKVQEGSLFIGDVIHKTFIEVNEKGTKAGAVTAVVMEATSAPMEIEAVKLNRPFMYMIIDGETNLPMFIGALMDVE